MRALTCIVLALACAACTSSSSPDGGVSDAALDGPLACEPDAGPSLDAGPDGPIQDMAQTHPPHQNACNAQQIEDYAQCQGAKNTALCPQFKSGGASAACGACIETPFAIDGGTASWGVLVFNGSTAFFNVEGCVNDALGTYDCGNALHHLYECEELVCGGCTGPDFPTCELESSEDPSFCKPLADLVNPCENAAPDAGCTPTGPCAAIEGATMPADAVNCFPDTSIQDSQTQEVDWLRRIVTYMCGP